MILLQLIQTVIVINNLTSIFIMIIEMGAFNVLVLVSMPWNLEILLIQNPPSEIL